MGANLDAGIGQVLGGYRLDALIGQGGAAKVYRATHLTLGRQAAVKVLLPSRVPASVRRRFLHESRIAARLTHPNVVQLYEVGEDDGCLYLAMQYVEGPDLRTVIAGEGRLAPLRAARILEQVAGALDAAHQVGLVHRDVKPANVLLSNTSEQAYLTDFGIAKDLALPADTGSGELVGTVSFIAPEQIESHRVGPAADVYSLGALLYNALTGMPPFPSGTAVEVLYRQLHAEPPRPSDVAPELRPFDDVVACAMAREPVERFATAGALSRATSAAAAEVAASDAARDLLPAPPPPPPPPSPPPPTTFSGADGEDDELLEPLYRPIEVPIVEAFRYVHEPLTRTENGIPFLGEEHIVRALRDRIARSRGGAFLVTGFRGVGKSTIVRRALEGLDGGGEDPAVLMISLDVASPTTTDALLFGVIRRLFDALVDHDLVGRLDPDVRQLLVLACTRTSYQLTETHGESRERSAALGLQTSRGLLAAVAPKLDLSGKRVSSRETEAALLPYAVADVEHDFMRLARLLREATLRGARRRLMPWRRRRAPWSPRIVIVLDELDKLTADDGLGHVELLLDGLKTLFTTAGVHFVFVGGTDLHDRVLDASQRGNSVFDSVFGWQLYVPCLWDGAQALLDALVLPEAAPEDVAVLRDHLEFKARGVPRLLLLELNALVRLDGDRPAIRLDATEVARVEFYAGLQRVLSAFLNEGAAGRNPFAIPIDTDRWRLGAYYVTDWTLRTAGRSFTVDELLRMDARGSMDPQLGLSADKVEALFDELVARDVLVKVAEASQRTLMGDMQPSHASVYRLSDRVQGLLRSFAGASEEERAGLRRDSPDAFVELERGNGWQAWEYVGELGAVGNGRYVLERELGRGTIARVYRGRDRVLEVDVAVKLLDIEGVPGNVEARARFKREARTLMQLSHPNVVRCLAFFDEPDGRTAIVSELAAGDPLSVLIDRGPLEPPRSVRIAIGLAEALSYLHGCGLARLDLKPANVVVDGDRPTLIDLGLAKGTLRGSTAATFFSVTRTGNALLGTPRYLAPEQVAGGEQDIRSDLYALGLVLVEMLTGRPARTGGIAAMLRAAIEHDVELAELPGSPALRSLVGRLLQRDPARRPASPDAVLVDLRATPEARA